MSKKQITSRRGKSGNKRFAKTPAVSVPRSTFNHSHGHTTTFQPDLLIPIDVVEILPGDTYQLEVRSFIRALTPLFPVMDQGWVETFTFFVPTRIIWDNAKKFFGEEDNPGDGELNSYTVPIINNASQVTHGSMADYFGLPSNRDLSNLYINQLPFRAMNAIYNEWFRPQDIVNSAPTHTDDSPQSFLQFPLQRRGKRHDYFTSCQPWAQKGPLVSLPLGDSAPVVGVAPFTVEFANDGNFPWELGGGAGSNAVDATLSNPGQTYNPGQPLTWSDPNLQADLSSATAATINAIREAVTLQQFYERQARAGTRYVEQIESMFGVRSPDMRQQRPEYLGSSSMPLSYHPVAQTVPGTNALGDLAAFTTGAQAGNRVNYSATEHGYIITLATARANITYQSGVHRMWTRQTRFDFAWPAFASLGEQEVLNKELHISGDDTIDEMVFGYNERYAEYRYAENRLSGLMRSSAQGSLDAWHLAQDFQNTPVLNKDFIEHDSPFDRTVSVQNEHMFKGDFYFDARITRCLPVHSVPGLRRF